MRLNHVPKVFNWLRNEARPGEAVELGLSPITFFGKAFGLIVTFPLH
ncbi:MAG: hypothetical protein KTR25_04740 [Myxococcales bacterium]|nr:hypothetical protein [Myxococcales bacterium]